MKQETNLSRNNSSRRLSDELQERNKIRQILDVGPIILFYITFSRMTTLTTENLNLEKACLVNIGFNESVCEALVLRNKSGYTADQEIQVQRLVTSMVAYKSIVLGIFPFFLMLFLGSWSDRHRIRKPFILMPICGEIVSCFGCLLCSFFFRELPLEVAIFFEAVPLAVTGYWPCFFVGIFSYITENSSVASRTSRMGVATTCKNISLTLGIALSGVLYRLLGFKGVYCFSILMFLFCVIYGSIVLKTNTAYKKTRNDVNLFTDIFNYEHLVNTLSVPFKNKKLKKTLAIIVILIIATLRMGSYRGEQSVTYMFTRRQFTWDELDFSLYNTYHFLTNLIGSIITITIFASWLKTDDAVMGMIAMISKIVGCLGEAFAPSSIYYYLTATLHMTSGTSHMVMRSITSKMVCSEELVQVYSISAACEALSHFVFGLLYSLLYHKTIGTFPGAFYILSASLHFVSFISFCWLYKVKFHVANKEHEGTLAEREIMNKEMTSGKE